MLLLLLHHIAGDGWSLAPLARDLSRFYEARRQGSCGRSAGLPVQYADYTLWQHGVLGDEGDAASAIGRQLATGPRRSRACPSRSTCRATARGRRCRAIGARVPPQAVCAAARRPAGAFAGERREPVHGAAGRACGAADAAGGGQRHPDRQPDRGPHRQRARRPGRVLRQHTLVLRTDTSGNPSFRELVARVRAGNLRPTATRICRSSGWWRSSTRRGRCRGIRCSR